MESGWIINYKDGRRVIMDEDAYQKSKSSGDIRTEEHWFGLDKAIEDNPGLKVNVGQGAMKKAIGYCYQCPKCGYTYKLYNGGVRPQADYLCPKHKIVMPMIIIEQEENPIAPVVIPSARDTGWIPVTDRLPEDGVNPITRDSYVYPVVVNLGRVTDVRYYSYNQGHWHNGSKIMDYMVLAWMQRPEPYQP